MNLQMYGGVRNLRLWQRFNSFSNLEIEVVFVYLMPWILPFIGKWKDLAKKESVKLQEIMNIKMKSHPLENPLYNCT